MTVEPLPQSIRTASEEGDSCRVIAVHPPDPSGVCRPTRLPLLLFLHPSFDVAIKRPHTARIPHAKEVPPSKDAVLVTVKVSKETVCECLAEGGETRDSNSEWITRER